MLDEEKKAIEQAISSVTRGVDIESAMLILEKCVFDGLIITRGRINIFKIAVRQIVVFLKEYKDKGYLDVVREKVKANETVEKQSKEIEELKEDRKKYAEEYIHNNPWLYKQLNENYILRVESEQREREAYIKGTNDADELCNKKWEDKIKAKIEELDKQEKEVLKGTKGQDRYAIKQEYMHKRSALQSLLEKE